MADKKKEVAPNSSRSVAGRDAGRGELDAFLSDVASMPTPSSERGRLIFALDATASRQGTWDRAMALQGDMFARTRGIAALDVQLVYYRGYGECRSSGWVNRTERLLRLMSSVRCEAGRTQIARVLRHGLKEAKDRSVQAMVFIGDAVEENVDTLGDLAGQLRLVGLPVFVFQEGQDAAASQAFAAIARLSGGAHCRFDAASPDALGRLLNAVAAYATGGRAALENQATGESARLLEQLG